MEKQYFDQSTPTRISQQNIYDTYCDNYDSIHYLFVEFQFTWMQQAYKALKDIDKYNILVYLYKENFIAFLYESNVIFCLIATAMNNKAKNNKPCPEKSVIKSKSGKVNSMSGVNKAIVPPPNPQK